ncbi:MAG: DUF1573 domain-containing protein [Flavobacteriaceae bacterium]
MKKISIVLVVVLSTIVFVSCKDANAAEKVKDKNVELAKKRDNGIRKGAAVVSFDKSEYDFGTVAEGTIVETTFLVKNTGKIDLVITDAKASCGCTVPAWPRKPIKVGETGEVKVKFNTAGKPNRQSKDVTLYTNTATGTEKVRIFGNVTPKAKK